MNLNLPSFELRGSKNQICFLYRICFHKINVYGECQDDQIYLEEDHCIWPKDPLWVLCLLYVCSSWLQEAGKWSFVRLWRRIRALKSFLFKFYDISQLLLFLWKGRSLSTLHIAVHQVPTCRLSFHRIPFSLLFLGPCRKVSHRISSVFELRST